MACYHPLLAYNISREEGKFELVFDRNKAMEHGFPRPISLPCQKCVGCRLDYSRQWANRCMLELQYHKSSYFITLTYDDEHLPRTYSADPETGEIISPVATLVKRDFQLFMKRLRKNTQQKLRFMAAGEYGTNTFRPHYHVILFGLELDDLVPYKNSRLGYQYYNSETVQKAWSDSSGQPLGFVVVGAVTWDTCAYVARYVMKKAMGPTPLFSCEGANIQPEFSLMSRRPGIGRQYYDDHPELWRFDKINISTSSGGRSFYPPRYYERLFDIDNPDEAFQRRLRKIHFAIKLPSQKLRLTDKTYFDILQTEEEFRINRLKSLRRDII
ncbi:replication initiator protein [Sigmofec virus UA08Rod_5692]|uniref:Replication initiator protein n=1 Tax=Sigmofec virus UA08Rod_5692 TaxID=2929436 RepID=A0A976N0X3_9VIRU|nr:replication initiator protein [Sigmofec virus UA08Rod_5692]